MQVKASAFLLVILLCACSTNLPAPIAAFPTNSALKPLTVSTAQSDLSRPLVLPSLTAGQPCPHSSARSVTDRFSPAIGNGPVYAAGFEPNGELLFADPAPSSSDFAGSEWNGAKVLWIIAPEYGGPVLIRGGRIDQPGEMRFDQDQPPASDIRIDARPSNESSYWRDRPSYTRFRSAGCYAYQVDGQDFTYTIVFEAKATAS